MIVKIWFEYDVVGDDKYTYIESFETSFYDNNILECGVIRAYRTRLIKSLLKRGIIIQNIKELC